MSGETNLDTLIESLSAVLVDGREGGAMSVLRAMSAC